MFGKQLKQTFDKLKVNCLYPFSKYFADGTRYLQQLSRSILYQPFNAIRLIQSTSFQRKQKTRRRLKQQQKIYVKIKI